MGMPSSFDIGAGIGKSFSSSFGAAQDASAIDDILKQAADSKDPNTMDELIGQLVQRVAPERQGTAMQLLKNKGEQIRSASKEAAQKEFYRSQGIDPNITSLDPSPQGTFLKNSQDQTQLKEQKREKLQGAFDRTEEILASGVTGFTLSGATPKGRRARAELDTLSEIFVGELIPILNPRGTLSKERMAYIRSLVPESGDSDQKIKGKLAGLKRIFAGDLSAVSNEIKDINQPFSPQSASNAIFKDKKDTEFVKADGQKMSMKKGDDKQMISALMNGYAPEGYVSMLAPDGMPELVPQNEVQNAINEGSTIIYGY